MKHSDFLVIGSGIAGLIYALDVCKHGKVTVLCKNKAVEGNTRYAQGGIASVTNHDDSFDSHIKDTLIAGAGLCNPEIVEMVVSDGPRVIEKLQSLDTHFDVSESDQSFSLGKEGGHSFRRILHSGDTTGAEIQRALLQAARQEPNIEIIEGQIALDFILNDEKNKVLGCYALSISNNHIETYGARLTCLASGGLGKVYLYTSNPDVATGDGVAMTFRAGAEIRNMEFIQFHPTCLYHPKAKNFLITEAMRGEGAYLSRIDGSEFMSKYHEQKELAPRDIVARAIDQELKSTGDDYVLLNINHLDSDFLIKRFPSIHEHLLTFGIDICTQAIPVVPAAHYSCGGVATDGYGRTSIDNLYAAGEVACSGLHGANRLASNSLLEAVVFGTRAAEDSLKRYQDIPSPHSLPEWDSLDTRNSEQQVLVSHIWDEIRRTMSNLVGIVRSESRLEFAKKRIETSYEEIEGYYWKYRITGDLIELRNIILVSKLIVDSALMRKESRGLHYIEDFPHLNESISALDTIIIKRR